MIQQPDKEGKYKLTGKEYTALLRIFATTTALIETEDILKDRLKTIPNAWRDFKMVTKRLSKVSEDILGTVPLKKLIAINREVRSVRVKLYVGPDADASVRDPSDQVITVNKKAFLELLDQIVAMNCMLCDKHGKEVKRCPWLHLIEDCLPYSPDPEQDPEDGTCQIAGRTSIIDEGE